MHIAKLFRACTDRGAAPRSGSSVPPYPPFASLFARSRSLQYILRPPLATERLLPGLDGLVRIALKRFQPLADQFGDDSSKVRHARRRAPMPLHVCGLAARGTHWIAAVERHAITIRIELLTRTCGSSPRCTSAYTVAVQTRRMAVTSFTVRRSLGAALRTVATRSQPSAAVF